MAYVKICGITNTEDAKAVCDAGASALGLVFYPKSKRYVDPARAREIVGGLPPFIFSVGVFVNADVNLVREIAQYVGLDAVQLHGDESPSYCRKLKGLRVIKALRIAGPEDTLRAVDYADSVCAVLYDTYVKGEPGGTGLAFPHSWLENAPGSYLLAGGLTTDNVAQAVATLDPLAVDVSSGVEIEPGKKDHNLVRLFVERARMGSEVKDVA
jgi:phosphoribosylanthranilate isomerase